MFRPIDLTKDSYIADIVSALLTYHGFYSPDHPLTSGGTVDTSKPQFMIAKEVKDASGNTTSMKWASVSYDQIWNDRASLTYA